MNSFSRLKWQCRRGTLELDIMLCRYLESNAYQQADEDEKQYFLKLLELQDNELLAFFMGNRLPDSDGLAALVKKIRALPAN